MVEKELTKRAARRLAIIRACNETIAGLLRLFLVQHVVVRAKPRIWNRYA